MQSVEPPHQHYNTDSTNALGLPSRSWWSRLTFQWFTPILYQGNVAQVIQPEDLNLVPLQENCRTAVICQQFEQQYNEKQQQQQQQSLLKALMHAFGREYAFAGLLKLCHDLCVFVAPLVLRHMIWFLRNDGASIYIGLSWTLAVTCSQTIMSITLRHYFFKCYLTGLRIRTAVTVAVYQKALRLSAAERQGWSLGEITNLMSIDAQRLQELTTYLHSVWSSPLQITLALFFLWKQLGPSSLGGVAVLLVMIPFTKAVAQWMGSLQKQLMKAKDRRINVNAEVLQGMKIIKFQAWEEAFEDRIMQLREVELKQLFSYCIGTSLSRMIWTTTPLAVALATFGAYVCMGHKLDVAEALTALTLFDILRFPLFMLPNVINNTVEALVSLRRVQSFLQCDEHTPVSAGNLVQNGVQLRNVSAVYERSFRGYDDTTQMNDTAKVLADQQWQVHLLKTQLDEAERKIRELTVPTTSESENSNFSHCRNSSQQPNGLEGEDPVRNALCLKGVDFDCKEGEFVAIVGGVGSGKSSLLNTILGEVRQLRGHAVVKGNLAYFSQIPYIMNSTVRENILFSHINESFDDQLYQRAIKCCALEHDLPMLPNGDGTEIGEKGLTLSGGQKARIALARAVYHRADVSLIDDALSAVDANVSSILFQQAIIGELLDRGNTSTTKRSVILVTNAIQYLIHPRVDRIVVLNEGRVVEHGTYYELVGKKNSVFSRFLTALHDAGVTDALMESFELPIKASATEKISEEPPIVVGVENKVSGPKNTDNKPLMTEEIREKGHVDLEIYLSWFRAAGGAILVPFLILFSFAMGEGAQVLSNWWLTYWSAHGDNETQGKLLMIYALINVLAIIVGFFKTFIILYLGLRASRKVCAHSIFPGKIVYYSYESMELTVSSHLS